METRTTYCRICEAACGLLADVEGKKILRLRPDREHVVSKGFVCAKGTRFLEVHESGDRVDHPLVRDGGRFVRQTWEQATRDAGRRLARIIRLYGPHAVGVYIGNPSAFSYSLPTLSSAFLKAIGTRNYFSAGSLDCNNKFVVSQRMLGSLALHPVPDLDHADFALLIGTNPSVSQSSFVNAPRMVERLKAVEARGGSVIVVDPRRTETLRSVGQWLPIVPDTDAALLLSLLCVIFEEGLEARRMIDRHASGVEKLCTAVRPFTPERVSVITRIPAARIRDLARRFAGARGAFCHVSTGVNQQSFGAIAYAAKIALELVTGNLDRRGGALMPRGMLDTAGVIRRFGLDQEPRWRSRIGGFPTVLQALPTGILADEISTPGRERIRALVVVAGNPLLSAPDGKRLRKALGELELLVSVDLFVNDTGAFATHVLPSTDWLEREDFPLAQLQLQPIPYLQWTDAVVEARGERRPEWRILADLAHAAGRPLFGNRVLDLATRAALRAGGAQALLLPLLAAALGPRPLKRLRDNPHGLLARSERPGDFLERRIATPSRRVELFPEDVYARLDELAETLRETEPAVLGLRLFTKRERLGHNSWMHSNKALQTPRQRAYVSREDAERLKLAAGELARLSSATGSIELPIEISADVVPGAVAVSHGYGHEDASGWSAAKDRGGKNVNLLAASGPDAIDPLTGMCKFVGVPVTLASVRASDAPSAELHSSQGGVVRAPSLSSKL